ncbi:MAG: TonB-dependent receptor [Acidobacteria bacterium]|nr:TonB-dependent receptor [Acidobacteriota bacterium]
MVRTWGLLACWTLFRIGAAAQGEKIDEEKPVIPPLHQSIVVTATPVEPSLDRRDAEVFHRTLFSRDDQILHVLDAGISAGQHEGGGKSLEIRRFGFNLDHGGVNGGLKVLVDDIQQNQSTQGHGQGYLGSLKNLSPELVQEVQLINGPFSAEYGDFSGLGVVHIRLRESLPDQWTVRVQGGSFNTARGFLGYSPDLKNADALVAYEGSSTDGPFQNPLRYRRDNVTGNYTRHPSSQQSLGFRFMGGRNDFYSSGQIPLDEVAAGRLDRFGFIDPTGGGRVRSGTAAIYYRRDGAGGSVFKADGFLSRSLFDLYSNFTFFRDDPENGDGIQQHDSRLIEGTNAQYLRPHRLGGVQGLLTTGANYHDNQINVGLYPRIGRVPTGVTNRANARVSNGAGYAQENITLLHGRVLAGAGVRFDEFRFNVRDRLQPAQSGVEFAGLWQPKASLAFTPSQRVPLTLHANYGRGISTSDARAVVQHPGIKRVATTDFYQLGASHHSGRVSVTTDLFWIDRSNEQVYVPDDGTTEFKGPSRAYGYEAKTSVEITRHLSLHAGMTKVANAYFRGLFARSYVPNAPHFVANAALTVSSWRGWSGSLRMRAINHYRLDEQDPTIVASGHTVFDFGVARRIRRGVEFNLTLDNLTDRSYYETQNYFESALPGQLPRARIHGTPGYPLTVAVGVTFRLRGK